MIYTNKVTRSPRDQIRLGSGLVFTTESDGSRVFTLSNSNPSPPVDMTGFLEQDFNTSSRYEYMLAVGFEDQPANASDVRIEIQPTSGDATAYTEYLIAIHGDNVCFKSRPSGAGSDAWGKWTCSSGDLNSTYDPLLWRISYALAGAADNIRVFNEIPQGRVQLFDSSLDDPRYFFAERDAKTLTFYTGGFGEVINGSTGTQIRQVTVPTLGAIEGNDLHTAPLNRVFNFDSNDANRPPGASSGMVTRVRLDNADPIHGWNGADIGTEGGTGRLALSGSDFRDGYLMALFHRGFTPLYLRITLAASTPAPQYVSWHKVIAAAHPTLALRGKLAFRKRSAQSITGGAIIANQSTRALFSGRISLSGYGDRRTLSDLARLDDVESFGAWPCGLETRYIGAQNPTDWRRPDFARNCVVTEFTGWSGAEGLDTGPWTGRLRFDERP